MGELRSNASGKDAGNDVAAKTWTSGLFLFSGAAVAEGRSSERQVRSSLRGGIVQRLLDLLLFCAFMILSPHSRRGVSAEGSDDQSSTVDRRAIQRA